MPKKSGFTLIELLVVITIIGILSVMGMAAYTSLTTKAKDIKKKADIDQIASVYELRYDTKLHTYKVLTDEDFSNNMPDTSNYTGVLSESDNDKKTFNICATLSDNTTYCKESAHQASVAFVPAPAPAPSPVSTPAFACADNTNDQVYTSTMIGCNGSPGGSQSVLFSQAASLCNTGWHVCSLEEYLPNGGRTIPSNNREQWLDTWAGCSAAALCGSGFFAISRPSFDTGCSFSSSNGCGNFIDQCGQNPACVNASSHQAQLWGAVCCKNNPPPPTPTAPSVTTLAASSIQSNSATFNSQLTNNDPSSTMSSWYRYGTTNTNNCSTLPYIAPGASFGNNQTSPVSNPVTQQGLLTDSTYYFCAIAATGGGTSYGNILSFSTPPAPCSSGLLTNGCFENQLSNWLCQGASTGTAGICTADSGTKYAGNYSAKVFAGTSVWGWQLAQGGITASANEQFCLSAHVKKGAANDLVFIAIQETADPWRAVALATQNTTDWQLVRLTVTRPADWSGSTIQVYLRANNDNSTAWFDDVSLTRGACL